MTDDTRLDHFFAAPDESVPGVGDHEWALIGGEGRLGSWTREDGQGKLVIGLNTPDVALRPNAFSNVWAWDHRAGRWLELCQPVEDAGDELVKSQTMFNTSLVDRGHLVLGGGAPRCLGKLGLWALDVAANRSLSPSTLQLERPPLFAVGWSRAGIRLFPGHPKCQRRQGARNRSRNRYSHRGSSPGIT